MRSGSSIARSSVLAGVLGLLALAVVPACSKRDAAEEHRKLSLRLEHRPPGHADAGTDVELRARVHSSLEGPKLEAWARVLGGDEGDVRYPMEISDDGTAVCRIPGRPRGEELRYVIEARDAAGLVVALPRGVEEGRSYRLLFEGRSSRVLGGISFLSALLGALLFLGAGAAGVQCVRGRMSAGPAGLLGGLGAGAVIVGLLAVGAVHAYQVTGRPWPSSPLFLSLSRADLGLVALAWVLNLLLGRRVLLDEELGNAPTGERPFAVVAIAAAALTLALLIF
jgi:hypothetical protein